MLQGCDENSFTQVVEIELPKHTPALAVTCNVNAGQDILSIFLSHSSGILENGGYALIKDATVTLSGAGISPALIPYDTTGQDYRYFNLPQSLIGTYTLEISAPGYADVTATQIAPHSVVIDDVFFEENGTFFDDGTRAHRLEVTWHDPAGELNYYLIEVRSAQDSSAFESFQHTESLDPTIDYAIHGFPIIDDVAFDGKKYTARFALNTYNDAFLQPGGRLIVTLRTLTRDGFLYARSRAQYDLARDNPFAEPVIVHSNITGGYGIFSLSNSTKEVLTF
jgi:hypothetical protein